MNVKRIMAILVITLMSYQSSSADNWTQFRGDNGSGTTTESGLPTQWSKSENVAWKAKIAGRGWSCPIVWENKIFVTTAVSSKKLEFPKKGLYFGGNRKKPTDNKFTWKVICFDKRTGKQLWDKSCGEKVPDIAIHVKNSYASETPVTDGKNVFVYFGGVGLFCFDMDGNQIWKKDVAAADTRFGWGTSSSPVIDDKRVFIQNDNEKSSFLVAFDKKSGDEVWRKTRKEGSSWSSPYLWKTANRTELITMSTPFTKSFDPATGNELWSMAKNSSITCATPISNAEMLFVSSGYVGDKSRPIYAVRPNSSGDISLKKGESKSASIAWSLPQAGPYNPSPLLYKNRIYVLLDRGFLACYDAESGKEIYSRKRLDGSRAGFTSSPWAYDGKIFCLNEDGDCFVVKAGDEFEQLHTNKLEEMCMATPAISDGMLYIRTLTELIAIGSPN